MTLRLLIAGGGTGGHLYPGIAIAEEVTRRTGGDVLFVGTARGIEAKAVPAAGFALELIEVSGLKRMGVLGKLRGLGRLPRALLASRRILRRFRPDVVVGVGGYASGPVVLAAALLGYPTAVLEENSVAGFTNRILGRFVRRVFVAFDQSRRFFAAQKTLLTGNPVRRRFLEATEEPLPASALGTSPPRNTLLIVGGSQGARAVNDLVIEALPSLLPQLAAGRATSGSAATVARVVHQTGASDEARVRARYAELGLADRVDVHIDLRPFIDDMPGELRRAALVIGRAGALTLAELAIVGCPAVLIPLPTAADDHQTHNAAELAAAGAAVLLDQRATNGRELADRVAALLADPQQLAAMSRAMSTFGHPAAAREIVDDLEKLRVRPQAQAAG